MGRESFLDVLRFVAAAAVVAFHFGFRGYAADFKQDISYEELAWFAKYGYLGVDVFFIISGYVIPWSIRHRSVGAFVVSRAIRLYPTFWLCAAISYFAIIAMGDKRFYISPFDAAMNVTMVSTWFGSPYIDGAYWSLALELQFYALVAAVVGFLGFARLPVWLLIWLAFGAVISALIKVTGTRIEYLGGQYYMHFCLGAAIYLLQKSERSARIYVLLSASIGLMWLQTFYTAKWADSHYHGGINPFVACAITTAGALAVYFSPRIRIKYVKTAAFFGGVTYPMYLLHENVGFSMLNVFVTQEHRWLGLGVVVGSIVAVSCAVYVWFDSPVRAFLTKERGRSVHRGPHHDRMNFTVTPR